MHSDIRRSALVCLLAATLLCSASFADPAAVAPPPAFPAAYAQAAALFDQGAYAHARQILQDLVKQAGITADQRTSALQMLERADDALYDQYAAQVAAGKRAEATAAEITREKTRRAAEYKRLLDEADRLEKQAEVGDPDHYLDAARLRAKVAAQRAASYFEDAVNFFEQGEYEKAGIVFTRLKEWIDQQRQGGALIQPSIGPEREARVSEYLARLEYAPRNLAAAQEVAKERASVAQAQVAAQRKYRDALQAYERAVTAYDRGAVVESEKLFKEVQASGVDLGARKTASIATYLDRIAKRSKEIEAKRVGIVASLTSGQELVQKGDWRAADQVLASAVREQDLLTAEQRQTLAGLMTEIASKRQEVAAEEAKERARTQLEADAVARAESYLQEVRRQRDILEQQESVTAQTFYDIAHADFANLKYDAALRSLEEALKHQPSMPEALKLRAEIRALQGKPEELLPIYRDAITEQQKARLDLARSEMELAIQRGRNALDAKNYPEAIRQFDMAKEVLDFLRPYYDVAGTERQLDGLVGAARTRQDAAERSLTAQRIFASQGAADEAARQERLRREQLKLALFADASAEFSRGNYKSSIALSEKVLALDSENTAAVELIENANEQIRRRAWRALYDQDRRAREEERLKLREKLVWPMAPWQYPAKEIWDEICARPSVELPSAKAIRSPTELRLQALLKQDIAAIALPGVTLQEAVEILRTSLAISPPPNFRIDPQVPPDTIITLDLKEVSLDTVLKFMLRPDLNYIISNNTIFISTIEGCLIEESRPENLSFRQYDISDLLIVLTAGATGTSSTSTDSTSTSSSSSNSSSGGGAATDDIMNLIVTFTGPDQWDQVNILGGSTDSGNTDDTSGNSSSSTSSFQFGGTTGTGEEGGTVGIPGGQRRMILRQGYLMVNHVDRIHKEIENLLAELRTQTTIMVTVEARLITFTDDFFKDIGFDWTGIEFSTNRIGPKNGPNFPAANWAFDLVPVTNVTPALSATVMNLSAAFIDHGNAALIVHAVKNSRHATVVSAPHVTVMNTQEQQLTLSQQGTYVSGYSVQNNIAVPTIGTYTVSDVSLTVTPVVSADRRYVTLTVEPQISTGTLVPQVITIPVVGAGNGGTGAGIPASISTVITEQQTILSVVRVPDRGTVVLGGLSTASENTGQGTIPILCHIPILKRLVIRSAVDKRRTHLLFMVTPTIMLQNELEP